MFDKMKKKIKRFFKSKKFKTFIATLLIAAVILCLDKVGLVDAEKLLGDDNSSQVTSQQIQPNINVSDDKETVSFTAYNHNFDIVPWDGQNSYIVINNNNPFFTDDEITDKAFEEYSDLDSLGRCGMTWACIGQELMPTADRESISSVKPSGWKGNNNQYDWVDGKYVYNRCHLIGFQLTGENANKENLITGTRYLNVEAMLTFENMVADYIKETDNHVMYRVTPLYLGNDLVAYGVLMEAISVEDNGADICFNVFCYNVQPGVEINYATGENWAV